MPNDQRLFDEPTQVPALPPLPKGYDIEVSVSELKGNKFTYYAIVVNSNTYNDIGSGTSMSNPLEAARKALEEANEYIEARERKAAIRDGAQQFVRDVLKNDAAYRKSHGSS